MYRANQAPPYILKVWLSGNMKRVLVWRGIY